MSGREESKEGKERTAPSVCYLFVSGLVCLLVCLSICPSVSVCLLGYMLRCNIFLPRLVLIFWFFVDFFEGEKVKLLLSTCSLFFLAIASLPIYPSLCTKLGRKVCFSLRHIRRHVPCSVQFSSHHDDTRRLRSFQKGYINNITLVFFFCVCLFSPFFYYLVLSCLSLSCCY